jgi:hypothetical protein
MDQIVEAFLKKIDENWQPADFLPERVTDPNFLKKSKNLGRPVKNCPMITWRFLWEISLRKKPCLLMNHG